MNNKPGLHQPLKALVPASLLNLARYFYSPGYRMGRRAERLHQRMEAAWLEVADVTQGMVFAGPFHRMKYIQQAVCSALPPKVLGTYEMELHDLVETIVAWGPSCIVDIGAAEGFYAVGFAMRLPDCRVVAFESDAHGRDLLRQLASLNGVSDRMDIRGHCSSQELEACLAASMKDCVIVCDAEGAELPLLDPVLLPMLARLRLLVELHPWVHPEIKAILCSRFQATSTITTVASRPRAAGDFPPGFNRTLSAQKKLDCMNELRPPGMEWLWIEPKGDS